jgi:phospholipid/cholesterol/gamma-HCH transport system permease protein
MHPNRIIRLESSDHETLDLWVGGDWALGDGVPDLVELQQKLAPSGARLLRLQADGLGAWDSSLVAYLVGAAALADQSGCAVDPANLPSGLQRLLALARAVPEKEDARSAHVKPSFLERLGEGYLSAIREFRSGLSFVGEATLSLLRLARGQARFRRSDLMLLIEECGVSALPIVILISFLVGMILAFVGAIQLQQFGAEIYVANLVGIAMLREMGAMMAGIIMAGRTGAAFAAQLGTMRVTQEMDALTTMGISPMDFVVLPRMIALCLMMPLLALFADLVGVLGGAAVGATMLDLAPALYLRQTVEAVSFSDFTSGLLKSAVFGVLIAVAGCLRGMQCGNSSSAVGEAATSAVVTGIVLIIVADATFTVLFNVVGF